MDDPFDWVHFRAEGNLEFVILFFIPKKASPDIFRADYQSGVKLYVNECLLLMMIRVTTSLVAICKELLIHQIYH